MSDDEKNRDNGSFEEIDQRNSDDEKMRENDDDEKIRENNDDQFILFIKDSIGNDTMIKCSPSEKISKLKELIAEKLNIPPNTQRLLYKNIQLEDDKTLFDYDIELNSTIHLIQRLHGGLI